jgi:hypothetical protein
MLKRDLDHYIHLRELDNRGEDYKLQLILERDALRAEVQRLRQALKDTVRHE